MDFKTILTRFGLDSSNFVNKSIPQIETEHGYIYEVEEIYKTKSVLIVIMNGIYPHAYRWIEIKQEKSFLI